MEITQKVKLVTNAINSIVTAKKYIVISKNCNNDTVLDHSSFSSREELIGMIEKAKITLINAFGEEFIPYDED